MRRPRVHGGHGLPGVELVPVAVGVGLMALVLAAYWIFGAP